jgi:hypothetical protein
MGYWLGVDTSTAPAFAASQLRLAGQLYKRWRSSEGCPT